jgi:hypothetical protein
LPYPLWSMVVVLQGIKTPAADDSALAEVVRRLVAAYQPERVYLSSPKRRRSRLAYQVIHGTGTAADVLVCTRSYFEERRLLKASLPGTVLREGRLLHAA